MEAEFEHHLMDSLRQAIHKEIKDKLAIHGDYPTWIIYATLSMELCSLAVSEEMSLHSLIEGVMKTYKRLEKCDA